MPTTTNIGLSQPAHGGAINTWDTDLNGNATILDNYFGVTTTKAVGGVNITLSSTEVQARVIRLTGVLSANIQLIFPNGQGGSWVIDNATTGAFTVNVINATQTSTIFPTQGFKTLVTTDGTTFRNGNDVPPPVFGAAGASAAIGSVPSPGAFAGPAPRLLGDGAAFVALLSQPQGRLTLTSATPVTSSDVTAATTVYYTNYVGNLVPVYCGGYASPLVVMAPIAGGNASLALNNPSHAATSNYDVFAFLDPADNLTFRIGTGPAWTSATARGTGAGTTELVLTNGIYMNAVAITLRNGVTTYSIGAASRATYLGTIRTTSSAGQTEDSAQNRLVWNAYNQVARTLMRVESTASWAGSVTGSGTYRSANGTSANQVSTLVGLIGAALRLDGRMTMNFTITSGASNFRVGIGNASTTNIAQMFDELASATVGTLQVGMSCTYTTSAQLGYISYWWLENWFRTGAGTTATWVLGASSGLFGHVFG